MVLMSKYVGTFVCSPGRSGTVYLERLFNMHALDGVRVLHEKHAPTDVTDMRPGEHLIITGRKMLSELFPYVAGFKGDDYEPRFVLLIRELLSTCLSWTRFLLPDYVEEKVPGWWYGRETIPFDPRWTAFQRFVWHWFVTWMRTGELLAEHHNSCYKVVVLFRELNDVRVVNGVLSWVGSMKSCTPESIAQCRAGGMEHGTTSEMIDRVGEIDTMKELLGWVDSLNARSLHDCRCLLSWLRTQGHYEPTAWMFGV